MAIEASKAEMLGWLFDSSPSLMHILDRDGRLRLVNAAWRQLTGLSEQDLLEHRVTDFVHPDDARGVRRRISRLRPGRVSESEIRLRGADGEWRWYATRAHMLEHGYSVGILRDVTDAHARAAELDEARQARRMLGAAAGVGLWSFEPADGRVTWSEELLQILGLGPNDMRCRDDFDRRVCPKDLRRVRRALLGAVVNGGSGVVQYRMNSPRGWLTLRTNYQAEPRPGGAHALRGIIQDVTELVAARDAARRGERRMRDARREAVANAERLKLALEVAEAGVYEIDHVAQTFWASPELQRLTGSRRIQYSEVMAVRWPRFHPDDLELVRERFRQMHRGERPPGEAFEARMFDAEGRPRWVRVFHHLQPDRNGGWRKAVGLVHDIDADKRQELALIEAQQAAEAAAEAKSAFLANMSHEIRTPMNGVMGVLHLLRKERLSDEGRMLLDEAVSCGQMLAELLNDVIDFSKIEAGRLELAYEPIDPKAVVDGVLRLLRPQAEAKSLRLLAEGDPELGWVRSDPVRLRQALFNLAGNAVKFTDEGTVTVRFRRVAPGRLRFEIQDTGVGIPVDAQARIFERFDQGDVSTTRRFGGSGLGLTITRRLAQLMGGDVGFTSSAGQGSTFWLDIAAEPAEAQGQAAAPAGEILDGVRILVVEDNATNRMIATKLLEQLGASVETAADGYLGVEAAARGGFDLILMDVQMPGIDGLETARRIRALGPPISAIPIVALTANVLAHQRQAYLDAGIDGVVGKPISPAALLGEIARLGAPADDDGEAQAVA